MNMNNDEDTALDGFLRWKAFMTQKNRILHPKTLVALKGAGGCDIPTPHPRHKPPPPKGSKEEGAHHLRRKSIEDGAPAPPGISEVDKTKQR